MTSKLASLHFPLIALWMVVSFQCSAATVYFDRASFDAAAPGLPIEDFEEAQVANGAIVGTGTTLDSSTNDGYFQPGDILPGIRISASAGLDIENNWWLAPTKSIFTDLEGDPMLIQFYGSPVNAVGMDVFGEFTENAPTDLTLYDASSNVITAISLAPPGSGQFIGFLSDTPIDHMIYSVGREVRGVDNIAFGTIPEPGTLSSVLLAAIALMCRSHIRRSRI